MSDNKWDGPEQKTLTPGEADRRLRTHAAMLAQGKSSDDEGYHADFAIWYKLEEIADKEAQFRARLDALIDTPDVSETAEIKKALAALSKEKAALMGESSGSTKGTEAQKRQVELIKAVRERMQEQYDRDDKVNRMQALRDMKNSGELRRLGFKGDRVLENCRKLTDPNQVKKLGLELLPR